MLRRIHIAAFHRIEMDVLQLLPHHVRAAHQFSMTAFLPDLIITILLVRSFGKA